MSAVCRMEYAPHRSAKLPVEHLYRSSRRTSDSYSILPGLLPDSHLCMRLQRNPTHFQRRSRRRAVRHSFACHYSYSRAINITFSNSKLFCVVIVLEAAKCNDYDGGGMASADVHPCFRGGKPRPSIPSGEKVDPSGGDEPLPPRNEGDLRTLILTGWGHANGVEGSAFPWRLYWSGHAIDPWRRIHP